MANDSLDILIRFRADLQAQQAAIEGQKQFGAATADTTAKLKALEAGLKQVDAATERVRLRRDFAAKEASRADYAAWWQSNTSPDPVARSGDAADAMLASREAQRMADVEAASRRNRAAMLIRQRAAQREAAEAARRAAETAEMTGALGAIPGGAVAARAVAGNTAILAAAAGAGGAAVGIAEYAAAEQAAKKLAAALAQTGQFSQATHKELTELANQMERVSGVSDDRWSAVITRFLQLGGSAEQADEFTDAVSRMADIMGGDLEGAAQMLNRALNGSHEILERRLGISLPETTDKADKLKAILEALSGRSAGLKNDTSTLTGAWTSLKNEFANVAGNWPPLRDALLTATVVMAKLGEALAWVSDQLEKRFPKAAAVAENAAQTTVDATERMVEATDKYKDKLEELATASQRARQFEDERADAETALAKAQVDQLEADGKIDNIEALFRKREIDQKAKTARNQRAIAEAKFEEDEKRRLLAGVEDDLATMPEGDPRRKEPLALRTKLGREIEDLVGRQANLGIAGRAAGVEGDIIRTERSDPKRQGKAYFKAYQDFRSGKTSEGQFDQAVEAVDPDAALAATKAQIAKGVAVLNAIGVGLDQVANPLVQEMQRLNQKVAALAKQAANGANRQR